MRTSAVVALIMPLSLAAVAGCIDNDRMRVQRLIPGPDGSFNYSVQTNTVITPNDDGAAEVIRRQWLADNLTEAGLCTGGYAIYRRELVVPPQRPALTPTQFRPSDPDSAAFFGNTGYVVYSGACL